MRYVRHLLTLSLLAAPAHAQDVADFAEPCFVEGQTLENAVAGFEAAGWIFREDEAGRTRIAEALGVSHVLYIRAHLGDVTSEAMDDFAERARSEGVRTYALPPDVLLFERDEMVAAWVLLAATRYQDTVLCNFAAPEIALLSDALPPERDDRDFWSNGFSDVSAGDEFETRVTGIRLTVGEDLDNTPAMRDAYLVTLNWHEVPE